ncbi:MAG: hypothetical protein CO073_04120 [Candidatus Komeilibacteria bacterium CG_4_9_14_0_8_um_filter_36_9]|uniref:Uncharacterized protein n=1 Tax=Candidatus Komeilibacteria bacterium CG_4_9_14_0_8_um_filter_36_9 TaxID=1974473 RepID=A0A2M8DQ91_9BACT|nr:MAG: hypothetical protein CO073_04120 [Candidatus Komeilibacteria bacterium CG_4_9_14_0_8_um_filter_36_9]
MFKLTGRIKKEEIRDFTRKDGTDGQSRLVYLEPEGSLYPVKVNIRDMDLKIGKQGDLITLDVEIFPYYIQDKKRKRAFADYYIPSKN